MVRFVPDTPITSDVSNIVVDGRLLPGRYVFQLVVVDEQGNESRPDERTVVIRLGDASPWLRLFAITRLLLRFLSFR